MTSKTLFRNLLKDDLQKRRGLFIVFLFCFIFVHPISLLMYAERLMSSGEIISMASIRESCIQSISFTSWGYCVLPVIFAIILAIAEFSFLFSKRKIDLYHSLPVKRETLFFTKYISGFLMFIAIIVLSTLLNIAAMAVKGFAGTDILSAAGSALLLGILYFTLFYNLSIVAILLTGNFWISIFSIGFFIFYIPVVKEIIEGYFSNYMSTYYMQYDSLYSPSLLFSICSPVISIFYMIGEGKYKWLVVLAAILLAVLLLALSIWIYKKRPSEASGHALCFAKTEIPIRFLMIIPSAMLGGYYVVSFFSSLSVFWFWFTFVLAGILCHCLLEVFLHFDIKAVFNHKLQLLSTLIIAAVLTLAFQYDWFSYDRFLPSENKVEYASICFENIDTDMNVYEIDSDDPILKIQYSNHNSVMHKNMKLTNITDVLSLAKIGIEQERDYPNTQGTNKAARVLSRVLSYQNSYQEKAESMLDFSIRYHMKSGKDIYRHYYADINECINEVSSIYNCSEYKEVAYQIDDLYSTGIFKQIDGYSIWDEKVFSVTGKELDEFIKAYTADLNELTVQTLQTETPIMRLNSITDTKPVDSCDADLYGYYIYPSFKHTLAFINQSGIDNSSYDVTIDSDKIVSIHPYAYYDDYDSYDEYTYSADNYKDKEKIAELGSQLIIDSFLSSNQLLYPYNDNFSFELQYVLDNGVKINTYAVFPGTEMPQFIYDDLGVKPE